MSEARRRTISRRDLARHPDFESVSPQLGELDEAAFDELADTDLDEALSMLADLTGATDERLRALARRLAGRIFVDVARRGRSHRPGIGRIAPQRYRPDAGDLDVDASLEEIASARAARRAIDPDHLRVRGWVRPSTAICLLVDRSGSATGRPLATNAVAAAAVSLRAPDEHAVLSFGREVVALRSMDHRRSVEEVIDGVLALRGHGTTDVAGALRAAAEQLGRTNAGRKITVLLSDCRATEPGDVEAAAVRLEELVIVAPADDADDARELSRISGAPMATVSGPSELPDALARLLG